MNIISLIKAQFGKRNKPKRHEVILPSPARVVADKLKQISINCRCGDISTPIENRGEIYRCVRCGEEQVGKSYNLYRLISHAAPLSHKREPLIDMYFYDAAIILLRDDKE